MQINKPRRLGLGTYRDQFSSLRGDGGYGSGGVPGALGMQRPPLMEQRPMPVEQRPPMGFEQRPIMDRPVMERPMMLERPSQGVGQYRDQFAALRGDGGFGQGGVPGALRESGVMPPREMPRRELPLAALEEMRRRRNQLI